MKPNSQLWPLARPWLGRSRRPDEGLTLLECLVAIVMLAIVGVAVTPPLFLATASRVRNNQTERAVQLAQGEIDKVRVLVELGRYTERDLPSAGGDDVRSENPPNGVFDKKSSTNADCDDTLKSDFEPPPANSALPVDVDGDCYPDFLVQTYRSANQEGTFVTVENEDGDEEIVPVAFEVGVRVWPATDLVRDNLEKGNAETEPASLAMTSAVADEKFRPLAVLYSQVIRADTAESFESYCRLLGGTENECRGIEDEE